MSKKQLYRLIAGILGLIGVSLQIMQDGWGMLLYYTVLSNIMVFSFMFYLVYLEHQRGAAMYTTKLFRLKAGVTMAITITFLVYHFMLAPFTEPEEYWNVRNFIVHYIAPLLLITDTLFFDHRRHYAKLDPFRWTIVPLVYFAFGIFNGSVLKFDVPGADSSPYPYYFIDLSELGVSGVFQNSLMIFIGYVLIGYLLFVAKRYVGAKEPIQK